MEPTGERYLPSMGLQMSLEHWHRYILALPLADGKDVLDVACGQGYGSNFLARRARTVVGVDISPEAVAEASASYAAPNLRFLEGSVSAIPLPDQSIDLIVSFETIEHVGPDLQRAFFDEVRRVLRPSGRLVISTPDKATYSTARGFSNPFHVREYERDEFVDVLSEHFAQVQIYEQRAGQFSLLDARPQLESFAIGRRGVRMEPTPAKLTYEYLIAVCSPAEAAAVDIPTSVAFDEAILSESHDSAEAELIAARATAEERAEQIRELLATNEQTLRSQSEETLRWMIVAEERSVEIERTCADLRSVNALAEERATKIEELSRALIASQAVADERAQEIAALSRGLAPFVAARPPSSPLSDDPLVSVAIPSYNHRGFIAAAVDSVLAQTHRNIEVIIIDDGSSDGSAEVLAARYGQDPRVRLIARENRGAHATINEALGLARGELLTILNSDDVYEPRRFACLIERARQHGGHPFFGISGLRVVDERGLPSLGSGPLTYYSSVLDKLEGKPDEAAFWVGNLAMTTSNFFFSRQVFEAVGPFAPLRYTHDWDWALRASQLVGLHRASDVLLHYRVHASNTISESNIWKHVAENAYVFATALRRAGLSDMALAANTTSLEVFRALLSNESFGPIPALFLLSLGVDPAELEGQLTEGELERLMPQVLGASGHSVDLMLSVEHLRRKLKSTTVASKAGGKRPIWRRTVAAVKKATKRVRSRF